MFINKIKLTNFKNFHIQEFEPVNGFNFLIGHNGQGKTNVLDAIYTVCFTKSYHSVSDADLIRSGEDFYRIEGNLVKQSKYIPFAISYAKQKRKRIEFDQKIYTKFAKHLGNILCVMIAPDEQKLILGGSEDRRKLIDNALCQINATYTDALMRYQNVLEQRNSFLKNVHQTSSGTFNELIDIYDKQLSELAGYIYQQRKAFVDDVIPHFTKIYTDIAGKIEKIQIQYQSDIHGAVLYDILKQQIEKDKILEYTSKGIHKDDLQFTIGSLLVKKNASQGQQKTLLIALKLAICSYLHMYTQEKVLLLFDDLFDKLDAQRCARLLDLLQQYDFFSQVFFTDTHKDRIDSAFQNSIHHSRPPIKYFLLNDLQLSELVIN